MAQGRTGEPGPTQRRVLVDEAAAVLGISEGAVRMRVKRGTLPSMREGGRLYVLLNTEPTDDPGRPHDRDNDRTSELIATLREQLAEEREARRRADTIIAQLARTTEEQARTIRELEAPQEPSEDAETVEEEPDGVEPRSSTGGPATATAERSEAEPSLLWERVAVVILSILLGYFIWLLWMYPTSGNWSVRTLYVLFGSTTLAYVVVPVVFGFLLGRKVRSLRFWRNVAPIAVTLTLLGLYFAFALGMNATADVLSFFTVFIASIPGFIYMFSAILGNALRRREREQLVEERPSGFPQEAAASVQRWTPRQQAIVGLAGTIISALIGLIGTILTVLDRT